jgi:hypothetical protein
MAKELIQKKEGAPSNVYEKIPDTNILNKLRDSGITEVGQLQNASSVVIVRNVADMIPIDSSKVYYIDGIIDTGNTTIEIPAGGINLQGSNFEVSQLVSSEGNYDMFVSAVGGCGNILVSNIGFTASGSNSQVWKVTSLTGFEAFEFNIVNYNNCTKVGTITNFRQGLEFGTGRFGGTPTVELVGTWGGGYRISTSIVRNLDSGMTDALFKAGAGLTFSSRFITDINCDLPALAPFTDFSPSNFTAPSLMQLRNVEMTRDGVYDADDTNINPNISKSDLETYWKGNNGVKNTFVGGTINVVSQSTTTINTADVYEDFAGTFLGTGLEHFSYGANGILTHLGNSPREFEVTASLTVEGGTNDVLAVRFRRWDASAGSFIDLDYTEQIRPVNNLLGARDVAFFTLLVGVILDKDDYLQMQVKNISDTTNVTLEDGSYFRIQER